MADVDEFLNSFDAFAQAVRRARGTQAQSRDESLTLSQHALLQALAVPRDRPRPGARQRGGRDPVDRDQDPRRARAPRDRQPLAFADDRRGVTITLTEQGREALNDQDAWLRGRQRAFYDGLPTTEQELAPDLLVRLAALIDEIAAGSA